MKIISRLVSKRILLMIALFVIVAIAARTYVVSRNYSPKSTTVELKPAVPFEVAPVYE